jgi:hypothetical protein
MRKKILLFILLLSVKIDAQEIKNYPRQFVFSSCDSVSVAIKELNKCTNDKFIKYFRKKYDWFKIIGIAPYTIRFYLFYEIDTKGNIRFTTVKNRQHPYDSITNTLALQLSKEVATDLNESQSIKPALNEEGKPVRYINSIYCSFLGGNYLEDELKIKIPELEKKFTYKAIYAHPHEKDYLLYYQATQSKEIAVYKLNATTKKEVFIAKYKDIQEANQKYYYLRNLKIRSDYLLSFLFKNDELIEIRKTDKTYKTYYCNEKEKIKSEEFENILSLYYSIYQPVLLKN